MFRGHKENIKEIKFNLKFHLPRMRRRKKKPGTDHRRGVELLHRRFMSKLSVGEKKNDQRWDDASAVIKLHLCK
jgi:hypothetical protein